MLTNGNAISPRSIRRSVNRRLQVRSQLRTGAGVSEDCGRSSVIARRTRNYLLLGRPYNDSPTWPIDRGSLYQPERAAAACTLVWDAFRQSTESRPASIAR